jgi:hypothetical protein
MGKRPDGGRRNCFVVGGGTGCWWPALIGGGRSYLVVVVGGGWERGREYVWGERERWEGKNENRRFWGRPHGFENFFFFF